MFVLLRTPKKIHRILSEKKFVNTVVEAAEN